MMIELSAVSISFVVSSVDVWDANIMRKEKDFYRFDINDLFALRSQL